MDDYVNLKQVIEIISSSINDLEYKDDNDELCKTILALPRISPTRKSEWIIDGHHIRCGLCGSAMCNTDREGDRFPDNYCPNCGAYMNAGDNGNGKYVNRTDALKRLWDRSNGTGRRWLRNKKMTADEAYVKHVEMWTAMRDELGDNPSVEERSAFKWRWCITHDVYPLANCFLCQYVHDAKGGGSYIARKDCEALCPVNWGYNERFKCSGCALGKTQYDTSPISEILALPRREENNETD